MKPTKKQPIIASMNTFPVEIITNILLKLPTKSLLRFKCVSKFYRTLISSPEFIKLRHSTSSHPKNLLILVFGGHGLHCLDLHSGGHSAVKLPFPRPPKEWSDGYMYVGSCKGLVCALDLDYVLIFNLSTRVYKETPLPPLDQRDTPYFNHPRFGFGFDMVHDDYKLVMFLPTAYVDDKLNWEYQIFVYSMKGDSWRALDLRFYATSSPSADAAVVIDDDRLHLLFGKDDYVDGCKITETVIGCFDLSSEKWCEYQVPHYIKHGSHHHLMDKLGVFDGCLCLLIKRGAIDNPDSHELWVMEEYGVEVSWTRKLDISDEAVVTKERVKPYVGAWKERVATPLGYSKGSRDEMLLWDMSTSELVTYNMKSKTATRTEIKGITGCYSVDGEHVGSTAFVCDESLVSIPGGKTIRSAKKRRVASVHGN